MNKVRNKFVLYAMLSVFALLTVLLGIINGINFTMASADADFLTQMISERYSSLGERDPGNRGNNASNAAETSDTPRSVEKVRIGPMGPKSPDVTSSLRYFTFSFDKDGKAERISFLISAVSVSEAEDWARSLLNEGSSGWTKGTYRYKVYTKGKHTFVTVIDQGRELLPSYRILIISVCGELVGLALSFTVLMLVGKKLFAPLEEADRKQKKFIANIENEFKIPLTVVNASTEMIEKESGSSDYTKAINRQIRKMTALVKDIGSLAIFEEQSDTVTKVDLSSTLSCIIDYSKPKFSEKKISLDIDIDDGITIDSSDQAIKKMFTELVENAVKYSLSKASFSLKKENERITLIQTNDTELPNGSIDQIFDRFTVLENASKDSVGLGLSHVKDIVKEHNGRITAKVNDKLFTLRIAL